ncbi:MAG: hypothetical protein AB199_03425 [Parcubacteria bacterium C7867-004]|nr:MAG: hypothetical protein AB199_03425 [Parcubacteria bacterium C7867-004]
MRAQQALHNLLSTTAAFALLAFAAPAIAKEGCSNTSYGGAYNQYDYQDIGRIGSKNAVTQNGHTDLCGPWKFDGWFSAGKRDEFRGANEVDLTVAYTHSVKESPIGPIVIEGTASVYFFEFNSFKSLKDDAYDLHVDASRPIKVGSATVSPFLRYTRIGFLNGNRSLNLIRPGVRVNGPLSDTVSYAVDASVSMNRTYREDIARAQGDLIWDVGQKDHWKLGARAKLTEVTRVKITRVEGVVFEQKPRLMFGLTWSYSH